MSHVSNNVDKVLAEFGSLGARCAGSLSHRFPGGQTTSVLYTISGKRIALMRHYKDEVLISFEVLIPIAESSLMSETLRSIRHYAANGEAP